MTDNGYNVFWDEQDDATGRRTVRRKHFTSESAASAFAASLNGSRVFEESNTTNEQHDAIGVDNTNALNRRRLIELMKEHGITIPAKQFDKWRPTVLKTGHITGVSDGLTCIMTDGLLGYFIRDGREPLYGHVDSFIWDIPETSIYGTKDHGAPSTFFKRPPSLVAMSRPKPKAEPKAHSPMTAQMALALIERMTNGAMK